MKGTNNRHNTIIDIFVAKIIPKKTEKYLGSTKTHI